MGCLHVNVEEKLRVQLSQNLWFFYILYLSCYNSFKLIKICKDNIVEEYFISQCDFFKWRYLYSDFVGARSTTQFVVFCHIPKNVSWSTSELRARLAPWNWFKPSSKIFYWPFQGGPLLWIFYVLLSRVCYAFVCVCLYVPFGHLLGKDWPLGSHL